MTQQQNYRLTDQGQTPTSNLAAFSSSSSSSNLMPRYLMSPQGHHNVFPNVLGDGLPPRPLQSPLQRPPTSLKPIPLASQAPPIAMPINSGSQSISILSQDDIVLQTQEEARQRCKRLRQLAENPIPGNILNI